MPVVNFITIWEFRVKADARPQFEKIYGPDGDWAQLFRRNPEYLGTKLLHDRDHPERYVTLDQWTSREALQQFKREHHDDYASLDTECESLTEKETFIGDFESVAT